MSYQVDTGKLEDSIAELEKAKEKVKSSIDILGGVVIPDDYPGLERMNLNSVIDGVSDDYDRIENNIGEIEDIITNSTMADQQSEQIANSLFLNAMIGGVTQFLNDTKSKIDEILSGGNNPVGVSNLQAGGGITHRTNYYDSTTGGIRVSSSSSSSNKHFSTPSNPDTSASQIKFFDSTTGEQLIKVERVDGKDVFMDAKTGEVRTDLGAGGTSWSDDTAYLERMRQIGRDIGSSTGWFCIVDRDNFKTTVLIYLDGDWRVVKTYDCGTGRIGIDGIPESHTFTGTFTVDHKTAHGGPDDWWTCFIPCWKPDGTDFGQGFHEGYTGVPSYQSYGCTRLSTENAQWIFYNVPIGTTVHVFAS